MLPLSILTFLCLFTAFIITTSIFTVSMFVSFCSRLMSSVVVFVVDFSITPFQAAGNFVSNVAAIYFYRSKKLRLIQLYQEKRKVSGNEIYQ